MIILYTIFKVRLFKYAVLGFSLSSIFSNSSAQTSLTTDSTIVAIAPEYDKVSKTHRFWLGEGYRKLWATPVKMKVFHLEKEKGGLTILYMGGGFQTKSLRLKNAKGKEWVLRSIQKYPERSLPKNLRKTIARDILQDQVITGHPYAALTVPPFAKALGIPHAVPQIVYVPDDALLGKYRSDFSNAVFLFEEREAVDTLRTDNTEKAERKLKEDNDVTVDQKLVLRARLLDILLGDWDRHEDQWRWERKKEKGQTVYSPVPRDRDKVYYNTTGVLPGLLSKQWLKSNLQGFHGKIRDIEGYNFNNRYFDRYFLTGLSEDDWKEQINYVQTKITDSLIRNAIKLMPDTIYALSGKKLINTIIKRREILSVEALKYYRFISKYVDITATDKHELFDINYKDDGQVGITIYKIKKEGSKDRAIYSRTFNPDVTKEIRLYGFAGKDVFLVTGSTKPSIKIRMIGGDDIDSFYVKNEIENRKNLLVYDRTNEQNIVPLKNQVKIRTSSDSTVNSFQRKAFKYDYFAPVITLLFNLDQGLLIRAGLIHEKQGFRKESYAVRREFFGYYSTGRKSFMFSYSSDHKKIIGKKDLRINILSRGPHNVSNFFGVGNESEFNDNGKQIDYYRNRFDYINGDVKLARDIGENFKVDAGLAGQYYTSAQSNNLNHFLNEYHLEKPGDKVFSDQFYAGIVAGAEFNSDNNEFLPSKGFFWSTEVRAMKQMGGDRKSYGQLHSELGFYIPVFKDSSLVFANRVGGGITVGKPAFFQQMQLGGIQNLRGFRSMRFTGKTMLYNNAELRLKLFDFTSYILPGKVGLVVFNDVGRVWVPEETSHKWHDGYGGGLYVIPADLVLIEAVVAHSQEGTLPYISIGLQF